MNTTITLLLSGCLLVSYIDIFCKWLNFKKKMEHDVEYMVLNMLIANIKQQIPLFNSTEWKICMGIAFLLFTPVIFVFTTISWVQKFAKQIFKTKKDKQSVEVPVPQADIV